MEMGVSLKVIFYILLGLAFIIYRSRKEAAKKNAKPMRPGQGERKDGEFSPEELRRRLEEMIGEIGHNKPVKSPRPTPVPVKKAVEKPDDRLPFEKRKPLEKTTGRESKSREVTREVVDYDVEALKKKEEKHERVKPGSKVHFHFAGEKDEYDEWFDARKAIIYSEILKRPEY